MANITIGGDFDGLGIDYTQCQVEIPTTNVDTATSYTAQLDISVINDAHVIKVSNIAAKP